MKVLIVASEVYPFAKTGGLADVTMALAKELHNRGITVRIMMPLYSVVQERFRSQLVKTDYRLRVDRGSLQGESNVWSIEHKGIAVDFVQSDEYFGNRAGLYTDGNGEDFTDNAQRFGYFCWAVVDAIKKLPLQPDLVHCHDWQTALLPVLMDIAREHPQLSRTASLLTIHNLGFQGLFPAQILADLGLPESLYQPDLLEYYGQINILKGGMIFADYLTTVSPTYAREIQDSGLGFGLEGVLQQRSSALAGILNGIDYEEWNPQTDLLLPRMYGKSNVQRGKKANKLTLQKKYGLATVNVPVYAMVGRLTEQKGLDIFVSALARMLDQDVQVVILGQGEQRFQSQLEAMRREYPERLAIQLAFSEESAHLIYGGADFLMMPSQYEPCGLSQLIAMRYGTIPLVRKTGGLADSVQDIALGNGEGTGIIFDDYSESALLEAFTRCQSLWQEPSRLKQARSNAMSRDYSWSRAASEYMVAYNHARQRRAAPTSAKNQQIVPGDGQS